MEFIAFLGNRRIAQGDLASVLAASKAYHDEGPEARLALYHVETGAALDVNYRGSIRTVIDGFEASLAERFRGAKEVEAPVAETKPKGRGRPKLGVISREVSLLPKHWDWLKTQRGGASITLRGLVEAARIADMRRARVDGIVGALHKFIWDLAGDEPHFEEATRHLFAHDFKHFASFITEWPADIQTQVGYYLQKIESIE